MYCLKRFRHFITSSDVSLLEMMYAIKAIALGLWFADITGDIRTNTENILRLNTFMPEYAWGVAFIGIGIMGLITLPTNKIRLKATISMINVIMWSVMAIIAIVYHTYSLIIPVLLVTILGHACIYLRHLANLGTKQADIHRCVV